MMKKVPALLTALLLFTTLLQAQTAYKTVSDISYTAKTDSYARERLKLDVYYSEQLENAPVVVWFHGGGLEGGEKKIPAQLQDKGWVVVAVNYRLLPKVTVDQLLDDSAEAVAWVFRNIRRYGGDTAKIVLTGHSAGGYIDMMLCLNKAWLARYGVNADDVMLYVPFSGTAVTHYNVRKMQGIPPLQPTIDEFAPLFWARPDCPPLVLICGDRELELYGRYDENQYLARIMKLAGHTQTYLYEMDGHGHSGMQAPAFHILETHLRQALGQQVNP